MTTKTRMVKQTETTQVCAICEPSAKAYAYELPRSHSHIMPKILYLLLLSALLAACIPASQHTNRPTLPPTITPTAQPPTITPTAQPTIPPTAPPTIPPSPTAYAREFSHVAALDNYLVGTYYYPWYDVSGRHWKGYLGTPLLGEYSSGDALTINRHIDWATGHGIDFFAASWWGRDSFEDQILLDDFPMADLHEQIKIAILYESTGLLTLTGEQINLSDAANQAQLVSDMRYLAENYFDQPNYLHVAGQPVIFLYLTRIFVGDVAQTFELARAAVREQTGNIPHR